ncbi:MAG: hypothetical protein GC160_10390 [Acidobacteria bacterium]|nr:hypothetical protein [Acidobacteriota bacterium]
MMKKMFALLSMTLLTAGLSFAGEWTGFVSDAKCAKNAAGHAGCAKKCIEGGQAAVLVDEAGKVYQIANQDKVKALAGEKVKVTGSEADGKITVQSAEKVG